MKVLIAGASGFLGSALGAEMESAGHEVWRLDRNASTSARQLQWDGRSQGTWSAHVGQMDAVVNLTGYSLAHWPWTASQKKRFRDSRVQPALALVAAISQSQPKPRVFIQTSGVNFYGLTGEGTADESTPPGDDYLAKLTIDWEAASDRIETLGVRRIVTRNAVVLGARGGMLPVMALPVRLMLGGRLGTGRQAMSWIHLADYVGAVMQLLEAGDARGSYNLVAPSATSSEEFVRSLAAVLHRPYWLPTPGFALRTALGEMSVLITEGRYVAPKRLEGLGYRFRFPTIDAALADLYPEPALRGAH